MARKMKTVQAKTVPGNTLVIKVDPLKVALGRRVMPRGGTHGSGKHLGRARDKQQWRRQLGGSAEGRSAQIESRRWVT